jgi:CheY-like chemotaxis protein
MCERPRIALVDDDTDFIEMNRSVLEAKGYVVLCYTNAEEALVGIKKERPDLIITDLMMKTLDSGFSFSQRIKEDPRFGGIPLVIVTAIGSKLGYDFSPRNPEELEEMHADAYFDKPVSAGALIAKVEELLQSGMGEEGGDE